MYRTSRLALPVSRVRGCAARRSGSSIFGRGRGPVGGRVDGEDDSLLAALGEEFVVFCL